MVYLYVRQAYMNRKFTLIAPTNIVMYTPAMITPAQIRAARALIGWTQAELATHSGVSLISIKNIERGATDPRSSTLNSLQSALRRGGVVFLDPGDTRTGGHGVRLEAVSTET